jgi:hypothetical protein
MINQRLNRPSSAKRRNASTVELNSGDRCPKPERRADDSLTNDVFCAALLAPKPVREIDPTPANEETLDGRSAHRNDDNDAHRKNFPA